jgi:hypothetical protein
VNLIVKTALSILVTTSGAIAQVQNARLDNNSRGLTVTLQKMDISVQPVGEKFDVTLFITRQGNFVTVIIPGIEQIFKSSKDSVNFNAPPGVTPTGQFPTLYPDGPANPVGNMVEASSYPPLCPPSPPYPDQSPCPNYPLGGFIDTVDNVIPEEFRPSGGSSFNFVVESSVKPGLRYRGSIDNQGRLQFAALGNYPVGVGAFTTFPTRVTYVIGEKPKVTLKNFKISPGSSNAAKWSPEDYPCPKPITAPVGSPPTDCDKYLSIHFDFGDYDDPQKAFLNGTYYSVWADNSAALKVRQDEGFKNYAIAKIKVDGFGKTSKVEKVFNLNQVPGGETLVDGFSYAEGSVAIDPTNDKNVVVFFQQRKESRIGFVLSRSTDGGETWTSKLMTDMGIPAQPGQKAPQGGVDFHAGFDRFGGLWLVFISAANGPDEEQLVYSADKGETFHLIMTQPQDPTLVPEYVRTMYAGLDYDFLGIGPDATDSRYDTVWTSIGNQLKTVTPNEGGHQIVWGVRVKGLGLANIDMKSMKRYLLTASGQGGFPSIDVDPKGAVIISIRQTNVKGTFLEQLQNNNRGWINVLEHGLADDKFSEPREYALTAIGSNVGFPPKPHNLFLGSGSSIVAIDKSPQHPGRIYIVYTNRPNINSTASKPYLTWSDDRGFTWSNPINVSTDETPATVILPTIAIDPKTGVVALAWGDTRGSKDYKDVNHYGVFLDPRELY